MAAYLFVRAVDHGRTDHARLALFLGSILLTQFSIALHNGWCDRDADAIAKPWRWIPRGVLDARVALAIAIGLLVAGLLLAFTIDPLVGQIVTVGTAAGFAYNGWLKPTAWSWLPFAVALPLLPAAALAVGRGGIDGPVFAFHLIGMPLVLAIHLADSIADIEGDRSVGSRGLAVRLGRQRAFLACWGGALLAIAVAATLRPFGIAPGPLAALSLALLAAAVLISRRSLRAHWYLIVVSAIALSVDWLAALAR